MGSFTPSQGLAELFAQLYSEKILGQDSDWSGLGQVTSQ